ncbi:hypothetical protein ACH5RR_039986 [Cinchona calisaya]|uniref:Histone acetyltransferase n=1 Tax=Cinchona calisaya TaxID=153742 RepID=A0ABD2Y082_9GENT
MPRPGPRPYECVRRAWHSDRHQPIRGSLIQEIFRIVNEVHSSATKKNKEWQEKLPIVVLKAEEIMYSKANSEAEYVDVKTLWDRANDAINTIIRRDESTETGELLQPCIEAALHLGCTPRRSSRSQRNISPRCYLNPEKPETVSAPLSNLENKVQGNYATKYPFIPQCSNFLTAPLMNSPNTCINYDNPVVQNNDLDYSKLPFSSKTYSPSSKHQSIPRQGHSFSSSYSVYPLYYGNQSHFQDSIFKTSCKSNSNLMMTEDKKSVMEKHSTGGQDASNDTFQASPHYIFDTPHGSGCDLSLRLGPLAAPCLDGENSCPQEMEDGALRTCKVGNKSNDLSSQNDKDLPFFPKHSTRDMLDSSSTKWDHNTQDLNTESILRKRKVAISHPSEDRQFCWPLKVPFKQFNGRINNSDQ